MKDKIENCVELNIYAECNKCSNYNQSEACECPNKNDDDEACVKINVFVECDKKKSSYTL